MICFVLAMGKQHLGPHVVVGYGIKIFWPGLFITTPDHLALVVGPATCCVNQKLHLVMSTLGFKSPSRFPCFEFILF